MGCARVVKDSQVGYCQQCLKKVCYFCLGRCSRIGCEVVMCVDCDYSHHLRCHGDPSEWEVCEFCGLATKELPLRQPCRYCGRQWHCEGCCGLGTSMWTPEEEERRDDSWFLSETAETVRAKRYRYECTMNPQRLLYSQNGISSEFKNGGEIRSALHAVMHNWRRVEDFLKIKVFSHRALWYSADNRRLWVFKFAGLEKV